MPSDQQISIPFDIASDGGAGLSSSKLPDLMDLVADGYVEAGDGSEFYKLTAKGQELLSERGAERTSLSICSRPIAAGAALFNRSRFVADLLALKWQKMRGSQSRQNRLRSFESNNLTIHSM